MTPAADRTRRCSAECLEAKASSPCECNCGTACHGRGECDREAHRFGADGSFRRPTTGRFSPSVTGIPS